MKRVLVTGATGFFGGNMLRELCARGYDVRYISRGGRPAVAAEGTNAVCLPGDVTDAASLSQACQDIDWVIHAAALASMNESDRAQMERINIQGTRDLLAACPRSVKFTLISTVDTIFDFKGMRNPYPETKRVQEQLVHDSPLDTIVVNPGYMIGAYDPKPSSNRMVLEIMKGRGLFCSSGGNSFVDVLDVVRGTFTATEQGRKGEQYVLAGHNLTYKEFWTRVAERVGRRPPIAALPQWIIMPIATVLPMLSRGEAMFGGLPHYFESTKAIPYAISPIEPAIERARDWFIATGKVR